MVGEKQAEVSQQATRQTSRIWQQGPRILIVAEDPDFGGWLLESFQARGSTVALATTGKEGKDLLQSGLVDVVLAEMTMSDLPGMTLLQEVESLSRKPKVFLTTIGDREFLVQRALQNGATAVLQRPFPIERLVALVKTSLGD